MVKHHHVVTRDPSIPWMVPPCVPCERCKARKWWPTVGGCWGHAGGQMGIDRHVSSCVIIYMYRYLGRGTNDLYGLKSRDIYVYSHRTDEVKTCEGAQNQQPLDEAMATARRKYWRTRPRNARLQCKLILPVALFWVCCNPKRTRHPGHRGTHLCSRFGHGPHANLGAGASWSVPGNFRHQRHDLYVYSAHVYV